MGLRIIGSKYPQIEGETVVEGEIESGEAMKWILLRIQRRQAQGRHSVLGEA
jgi:hypothetical protein